MTNPLGKQPTVYNNHRNSIDNTPSEGKNTIKTKPTLMDKLNILNNANFPHNINKLITVLGKDTVEFLIAVAIAIGRSNDPQQSLDTFLTALRENNHELHAVLTTTIGTNDTSIFIQVIILSKNRSSLFPKPITSSTTTVINNNNLSQKNVLKHLGVVEQLMTEPMTTHNNRTDHISAAIASNTTFPQPLTQFHVEEEVIPGNRRISYLYEQPDLHAGEPHANCFFLGEAKKANREAALNRRYKFTTTSTHKTHEDSTQGQTSVNKVRASISIETTQQPQQSNATNSNPIDNDQKYDSNDNEPSNTGTLSKKSVDSTNGQTYVYFDEKSNQYCTTSSNHRPKDQPREKEDTNVNGNRNRRISSNLLGNNHWRRKSSNLLGNDHWRRKSSNTADTRAGSHNDPFSLWDGNITDINTYMQDNGDDNNKSHNHYVKQRKHTNEQRQNWNSEIRYKDTSRKDPTQPIMLGVKQTNHNNNIIEQE